MSSLTLDAEALYADLLHALQQLIAAYPPNAKPHLVGVASGGVWLAERLQQDLKLAGPVGILSSSMHRDDFAQRGLAASSQTRLPFDVNGADLIVLDDVLYTGRTVRAVLNELYDFGRPSRVQLAVLADRGGRELPICADYAGLTLELSAHHKLNLSRDAGRFEFTLEG